MNRRLLIGLFVVINVLLYGFVAYWVASPGGTSKDRALATEKKASQAVKPMKDQPASGGKSNLGGWKSMTSPSASPSPNPFASSMAGRGPAIKSVASAPGEPLMPLQAEFELKGVLGDKSGFLAVVEEAGGVSRTVKVGDQIAGASVVEIQRDAVIVVKKGRKLKVQSDSVQEIPASP